MRLADLRRSLRGDMRSVFNNYKKSLDFRRTSTDWSEDQKCEWILKMLHFSVRRAEKETDYYQNLFQEIGFDASADFSFKDYAKLPVLEREDIQKAGEGLISKTVSRENLQKDATGGSTGTPTEIWLGAEELGWKESGLEYTFGLVGVSRDSKMAFFWGHHLDPQASDSLRDRLKGFLTNTRWFDCFRLSPEVFQKYHEEFEEWSPDCIVAYSSSLGHFAEYLKEKGIRPNNYPQKCFVTGAEKLFPEHRKVIEEVFGKPVHERYGGRDFGLLGIQTNPRENLEYTIDWAWALVEPETDEENSPILVTKLHADGMPMLRYRVGDIGKFPATSRSGHPSFVLQEVIGRELDRIWLPDGRFVSGIKLPHLLKDFPVKEYMLIQSENYDIELQVVSKNDFDSKDESKISQILSANFEGLSVIIKRVESIPRTKANKWRPVITKVIR